MVRGVRPHAVGRELTALVVPPPGLSAAGVPLKPIRLTPGADAMAERVRGKLVESVERRAKRVVLHLSGGWAFAVEPRMTGLMVLDQAPTEGHVRLEWHLGPAPGATPSPHDRLRFWDRRGLGTVRLYGPGEIDTHLTPAYLGPDPLTMPPAAWLAALAKTTRPVKVALLDQKLAAGIGNLYASEILWHARVPPTRPADELTSVQVEEIAAAAVAVLTEAIRYVCSPQPAQWGALAALDVDVSDRAAEYARKRDLFAGLVADRFPVHAAEGAFYAFLKAPWGTGTEFVEACLEENLLVIPGNVFSDRDTHFRVSYAATDETIERGAAILNRVADAGPG